MARTVTLYEFLTSKSKEFLARNVVPSGAMLNMALSPIPWGRLKLTVSPEFGSLKLSVPTIALVPAFSLSEFLLMEISTGAKLFATTRSTTESVP